MSKICKGCGEVLQTTSPNKVGYINEALIDREDALCQRCFKLLHYGKFEHIDIDQKQFNTIFASLSSNSLVIYVLDIFNLQGSIIQDLKDKIGNCDVLLVVNKIDLLPKSLKLHRIESYVNKEIEKYNLNIKGMILVSSLKKKNIDDVTEFLKVHKYKEAYIIGKSNSGKSKFIHTLTRSLQLDSSSVVSSFYPGTTLRKVHIPLGFIDIYDTPGLESNNSIYDYLNLKNLKKVIPQSEIKPISMSIYPGDSLFIGSSCKIDFNVKEKTNIILYGSSLLKYHKTKKEGSIDKFNKLKEDKTLVPKLEGNPELSSFKEVSLDVNSDRKSLIINGLSIIDLIKYTGNIKVYVPKNVDINIKDSLFGGNKHVNK